MRKKLTAVLFASAAAAMLATGCGSKDDQSTQAASAAETAAQTEASQAPESEAQSEAAGEEKTAEGSEYQFVAPADAVEAAKTGETHVLDVREWGNYVEGRVAGSEWCPIFPLEDESLAENMTAYAKENLSDGKEIYIICNSGQRGAQKATGVLEDAGIDASLIYTVEGGAKALAKEKDALTTNRTEESIDWQYVTGKEAVEAVGNSDIQILDVRDDDTYAKGHLEGSLQVGLKEIEDSKAQTEMYELAVNEMNKEKPVYLLCYSGNNCAKTAVSVMKDAGFDTNNLFIIENGAKDADVQAAFVTE